MDRFRRVAAGTIAGLLLVTGAAACSDDEGDSGIIGEEGELGGEEGEGGELGGEEGGIVGEEGEGELGD